jgi:hypothetical protein
MNCKEFHKLLLENTFQELNDLDKERIVNHTKVCNACSAFADKNIKAEKLLSNIKTSEPFFSYEDIVTGKIMKDILEEEKSVLKNFIDRVTDFMLISTVKFSLTVICLFLLSFYFYQEIDTAGKIVKLEERYGEITESSIQQAQAFSQTIESATWLYNVYKFFAAKKEYFKVSNDIIVIRKEQLANLLKDFNQLDDTQKKKILMLRNEIFSTKDSLSQKNFQLNKSKISNEIEKIIVR